MKRLIAVIIMGLLVGTGCGGIEIATDEAELAACPVDLEDPERYDDCEMDRCLEQNTAKLLACCNCDPGRYDGLTADDR